jgi:hypothetical protein
MKVVSYLISYFFLPKPRALGRIEDLIPLHDPDLVVFLHTILTC